MLTLSSPDAPLSFVTDAAENTPEASGFSGGYPDNSICLWYRRVVSLRGPGLRAHGLLTGMSYGSLRLTVAIAIPVGSSLEITIPHCQPIRGNVMASKYKGNAFYVNVFFDPLPFASTLLSIGEPVWATQLNPPQDLGECRIMDRAGTLFSLACQEEPEIDSWIRVDTESAVVFGEVLSIITIDGSKCAVGVRLEVAISKILGTEGRC